MLTGMYDAASEETLLQDIYILSYLQDHLL